VPRYVVERTFEDGLPIPAGAEGAEDCLSIVGRNAETGVTWIQSFVSEDDRHAYCIYEGPSPEAIRKASAHNKLPVDRITEVRILDPYHRV